MERFVAGEVVIIDFPFSDLTDVKRRPAFVLATLGLADVILCQITSQVPRDPTEVALTAADFISGRLSQVSCVRVGKLFTLEAQLIQHRAGTVSAGKA